MTIQEAMERLATDHDLSFGETLGPAMEITDQQEANEYYQLLIDRHVRLHGKTPAESEKMVKINLGYYAGYYSGDTMERVNRLFRTAHPIFGDKVPTPEEAFEIGVSMASSGER